jgi:hypothetical protein
MTNGAAMQEITRAHLAIQCKATTGEVGDFLYVPTPQGKQAVSPVFAGLIPFYAWARREGWRQEGPGLMSPYVKTNNH